MVKRLFLLALLGIPFSGCATQYYYCPDKDLYEARLDVKQSRSTASEATKTPRIASWVAAGGVGFAAGAAGATAGAAVGAATVVALAIGIPTDITRESVYNKQMQNRGYTLVEKKDLPEGTQIKKVEIGLWDFREVAVGPEGLNIGGTTARSSRERKKGEPVIKHTGDIYSPVPGQW